MLYTISFLKNPKNTHTQKIDNQKGTEIIAKMDKKMDNSDL